MSGEPPERGPRPPGGSGVAGGDGPFPEGARERAPADPAAASTGAIPLPEARSRGFRGLGRMAAAALRGRPAVSGVLFVGLVAVLLSPLGSRAPMAPIPGRPAPRDVVATTELSVADERGTAALRRSAALEVPEVFDLDPQVAARVDDAIGTLFAEGRAGKSGTSDGVLIPSELAVFRRVEFELASETRLRSAVAEAYSHGILAGGAVPGAGILVRDVATGTERLDRRLAPLRAGEEVRQVLVGKLAGSPDVSVALASIGARLAVPNLHPAPAETARRRKLAESAVGKVVVTVPRGTVIVRKGDFVTPTAAHLAAQLDPAGSARSLRLAGGTALAALLSLLAWPLLLRATGSRERARTAYAAAMLSSCASILLVDGTARALLTWTSAPAAFDALLPGLPHATGPLLAALLGGVPAASIAALLGAASTGLLFGLSFRWLAIPLLVGLAAALAIDRPRSRAALLRAGALVGLVGAGTVAALRALETSPTTEWKAELVAVLVAGPISAALAAFLLPLLESLLGIATDLRLLELADRNHPLLRRLSLEAPGTFQHSLLVGNLAESAAQAIGANPLLARVCAWYHDIGKLSSPGHFVENTRSGEDRHGSLEAVVSARLIRGHVREGLVLAGQERLPDAVIDAIRQHHGTKPIRYFLEKAKEQGESRGDESEFRYPGPRPTSKELGILLLADACEAATRTLRERDEERISAVVERIVDDAVRDGQLDDSPLTLAEVAIIRRTFVEVLLALHHRRIDYPGFDFEELARKRRRHGHERHDRGPLPAAGPSGR